MPLSKEEMESEFVEAIPAREVMCGYGGSSYSSTHQYQSGNTNFDGNGDGNGSWGFNGNFNGDLSGNNVVISPVIDPTVGVN
jgi:hypothetical protein